MTSWNAALHSDGIDRNIYGVICIDRLQNYAPAPCAHKDSGIGVCVDVPKQQAQKHFERDGHIWGSGTSANPCLDLSSFRHVLKDIGIFLDFSGSDSWSSINPLIQQAMRDLVSGGHNDFLISLPSATYQCYLHREEGI